jgi:Ca2+-transporting ATPase
MTTNIKSTLWYQQNSDVVAQQLTVDPAHGISTAEAQQRLTQYGPNKMAEPPKEPGWKAFLGQYKDYMQIILVVAAVVSFVIVGDVGTAVLLGGLTVLNAVIGLRQEAKAEESLAALQNMLKAKAQVRRDGEVIEIPAEEVVPGDIVMFEAGDRAPADGRLLVAASLEIEESALTGESTPVAKNTDPVPGVDVPLGDRHCMAFMNCSVTRGRGEMIVTATGMETEVGHIAGMLSETEPVKTPLQKQLDKLTIILAIIAGVALVLIVLMGLAQGQTFQTLFVVGVAMAVSAIPTGLPAVVTLLLSLGTRELAQRKAIVKQLPAVETLGSTSAICSDKTGTLTLNKMTAREVIVPGFRFTVTGEGYSTQGQIRRVAGNTVDLDPYMLPLALCTDAVLDGEELVGDPTEGALIVLAEKQGIDVNLTRHSYPRVAEIPFDSDYKFMTTFHHMTNEAGQPVVRAYIKGAPDILIKRASYIHSPQGEIIEAADSRPQLQAFNEELAAKGQRVLVVAQKDFDPATFNPDGDLMAEMQDLTLLALVGMVDPPRPEARAAIAECKRAGIQVRMITGDHAMTAAAIGRELGITGKAVTGAEFAAMSDEQATHKLDEIGVIARVAPEDKVRLVKLLHGKENVVAMTGDGVNDAPALKTADIGVAMGITGTEVSKEAARMILTDDNFATIVGAVEYGRTLYDNLIKYVRFQLATLVGFILSFLGAGLFGIAAGVPFNPVQVLWLNYFVDGPIGFSLGFSKPEPDMMDRKPRLVNTPIITTSLALRLLYQGLAMTVGTLGVRVWAEGVYGSAVVAATMSLTAFSLFHIFNGLSNQDQRQTVFTRDTLDDRRTLGMYGLALLFIILATESNLLSRILETTSLSFEQWMICLGIALSLLVLEEILKFILRHKDRGRAKSAKSTDGTLHPATGRA